MAIALLYAAALFAFLRYNWYPARIMPGDSLTYSIGAVVAVVTIIGNIEKFALYCFVLWFIEFVLKARSRFKAQSFGILQGDGTLSAPYEHVYSLTHLVMKIGRFTEKEVTAILVLSEMIICCLMFVLVSGLVLPVP
jgi:UDP-N-acetylglucosamine--dolichyl-phosphate N-acetylglucosaminephosphotransferase